MALDGLSGSPGFDAIGAKWTDISWPLRGKITQLPDNTKTLVQEISMVMERSKGDATDLFALNIISHTGTHIDAPLHFIPNGATIDTMPIDAIMGLARIIEITDPVSVKVAELMAYNIQSGERILFKTQNSSKCYKTSEFVEDYVYLSTEAAHFLVDKKVSVVGLDYIAISSWSDKDNLKAVHETLLGAGIWILESINLEGVRPGPCELICLPLRLAGGDAAPARAIVRPL
jgi:arylformamidase